MLRLSVPGAVLALGASVVLAGPASLTDAHQTAKRALEMSPTLRSSPTTFLVKYAPGIEPDRQRTIEAVLSLRKVRAFDIVPGLHQVTTDLPIAEAMAIAKLLPGVVYAEPDWVVHAVASPNDSYYYLQYALDNTGQAVNGSSGTADADMNCAEAWDIETGDANLAIAVIDSGVQWDHPDLDGNIWSNPGEIPNNGTDDDGNGYVDDIRGWDFYSGDNNPDDTDGHGTHVAGTIAAESNNGQGVAGVMWQADIVPLRFLGPYGGYTSDAIAAVQYCTNTGIRLSNNSWGGGGYSTALADAIVASQSIGHLFLAAAGNSGDNTDSTPHYPSAYGAGNIISVLATNNRDQLASFGAGSGYDSNYGATTVDIGAPGVDIAATYPTDSYAYLSGTSMATPNVTGVVGLIMSQNPSWSWSAVRDRLMDTARPVAGLSGRCVTGAVANAEAAVAGGSPPANTAPTVSISSPSNGSAVTEGDSVTFSGSASDDEDGSLSGEISWSSNLDGNLGTGASVQRSDLSVGTHVITASVTDSGNLSDSTSVSLTVEEADDPPPADPPGRPDRPVLTDLGNGEVLVDWVDPDGLAVTFQVQRRIKVNGSWGPKEIIANVDGSVTEITDAPGLYRVKYRVRGVNAAGNSSWSRWKALRLR
ncbi:MAG: S8 family serine peptidase [Phycisphaerales bacterium]|nr:S8 family serine peptidase [Phycisphaerales bacterium]